MIAHSPKLASLSLPVRPDLDRAPGTGHVAELRPVGRGSQPIDHALGDSDREVVLHHVLGFRGGRVGQKVKDIGVRVIVRREQLRDLLGRSIAEFQPPLLFADFELPIGSQQAAEPVQGGRLKMSPLIVETGIDDLLAPLLALAHRGIFRHFPVGRCDNSLLRLDIEYIASIRADRQGEDGGGDERGGDDQCMPGQTAPFLFRQRGDRERRQGEQEIAGETVSQLRQVVFDAENADNDQRRRNREPGRHDEVGHSSARRPKHHGIGSADQNQDRNSEAARKIYEELEQRQLKRACEWLIEARSGNAVKEQHLPNMRLEMPASHRDERDGDRQNRPRHVPPPVVRIAQPAQEEERQHRRAHAEQIARRREAAQQSEPREQAEPSEPFQSSRFIRNDEAEHRRSENEGRRRIGKLGRKLIDRMEQALRREDQEGRDGGIERRSGPLVDGPTEQRGKNGECRTRENKMRIHRQKKRARKDEVMQIAREDFSDLR